MAINSEKLNLQHSEHLHRKPRVTLVVHPTALTSFFLPQAVSHERRDKRQRDGLLIEVDASSVVGTRNDTNMNRKRHQFSRMFTGMVSLPARVTRNFRRRARKEASFKSEEQRREISGEELEGKNISERTQRGKEVANGRKKNL